MSLTKQKIRINGTGSSFAFDELNKRILVSDQNSTKIHIYHFENDCIQQPESIDMKQYLTWLSAISISKKNEIVLACEYNNGVYFFNDKLDLLKKLSISQESVDHMAINENASEIYMMSTKENKVISFDGLNGNKIYEFPIDSPWNISYKNQNLYVISDKSVVIFETNSRKMINRISYENWSDLSAIFVDEKFNLFVIAQDDNLNSNYLFIFNKNSLINKIKMDNFDNILDMIIINDNLFVLTQEDEVDFYINNIKINVS
jgi:hypothetical protein